MVQLSGGQALVQSMKREGIETIFALPGAQLDWAFDALYEERESIRVIHTRHEQATSYMADGYARATGKIGACLVVPGPGVFNAGAGLSTAYACSSPVFCVAGQIATGLIGLGRGELHEIKNQLAVLESVTKWAARAKQPEAIPALVREACQQLRTGRTYPVALEVPPDVLMKSADVTLLDPLPVERVAPDPDQIKRAAALLLKSKRPAIYVGSGVLRAGAWTELQQLAEALEAPVVMSRNGRGVLDARHPLGLNPLAGLLLLPTCDLIMAVGTRFLEPATAWTLPEGYQFIQIDVDPTEVGRNLTPDVGIVADAKLALAALLAEVGSGRGKSSEWRDEIKAIKEEADETVFERLPPQTAFGQAIRRALPEDGVFVAGVNQLSYWSWLAFPAYQPLTYITSGYQGTLGSGYPLALGAQVGQPERKVVSVNGDGGFGYNLQELATARAFNIPVVSIVFDDGAFGNVKRIQQERFGGRLIAADLVNPDWVQLAQSFGVTGMRATTPEELEGALREAFATPGPVLIAVPVGEMPSPWGMLYPRFFQQR